jgi:hypothetical protein
MNKLNMTSSDDEDDDGKRSPMIDQTANTCNITYGYGRPNTGLPPLKSSFRNGELGTLMMKSVQTIEPTTTDVLSVKSSDSESLNNPIEMFNKQLKQMESVNKGEATLEESDDEEPPGKDTKKKPATKKSSASALAKTTVDDLTQ